MRQYALNSLIALDQLLNTLRGGSPDETLSAAAWRTEKAGRLGGQLFRPCIDLLFRLFEQDHCYKAYISELKGSQLPKEYSMRFKND